MNTEATGPQSALRELHDRFAAMKATDVAELFLSPFVHAPLFVRATEEPGPTLWIVNRSDVYDRTLEILSGHTVKEVADRAREKLQKRRGESLSFLDPPEEVGPPEEVPDFAVEDVLGHPLADFAHMLFFSKAISEDHRASSALSLTRRLLEHPPNWGAEIGLKHSLAARFSELLLEDHSPYVRSYAARVPILPESVFEQAMRKEEHPVVRARLLQNPASSAGTLRAFLDRAADVDEGWGEAAWAAHRVAAFDERLSPEQRRALAKQSERDPVASAALRWFLTAN
jgi:hypothetical protein